MKLKGVDDIDNKIIKMLTEDARISYSEISKIVGLTRPAVKNRIEALKEREIITGYRTIINTQKIPESTWFFIQVETKAEEFERIKETLKKQYETVALFQTTGNYGLVAFCLCESVERMRFFINKLAKEVPGIISLKYNVILDDIKGNLTFLL